MVPIAGTTKLHGLDENRAAAAAALTGDDRALAAVAVEGDRFPVARQALVGR